MSNFIPEEVVVDILSRLPSKSLIRFRSVSKLWYSLITSSIFINTHLNRSITNPRNSYGNLPLAIGWQCTDSSPPEEIRFENYTLCINTGEEGNTFDEYLELPFPRNSFWFRYHYLNSYAKGLFCVWNWQHDNCFLSNPSIRKSVSLPKPGITEKTHGYFDYYLGFGFDSRCNDYKIVRAVMMYKEIEEGVLDYSHVLVEVYSLNAGSWTVCGGAGDSFPVGFTFESIGWPACFEGAFHFAARHIENLNAALICSFDLGDEVFRMLSLPNGLTNATTEIGTIVFRGLLSLLCHDESDPANRFCSIWIMKEYGIVDSWYKYVKVDLTEEIKGVTGIQNNGHILLEGYGCSGGLSSYDPRNKEI